MAHKPNEEIKIFDKLLEIGKKKNVSALKKDPIYSSFKGHRKITHVYIRDHSYITSAKVLGGFKKWQFLLKFSTVFMLIWLVGGSEKVQKCADVIYGWPLRELIKVLVKRKFHDESIYWCDRFLKCCDHSDKRTKRNVLTTLMLNYWSIGNYEKVLKLGHEALAIPLGQFICHKNM